MRVGLVRPFGATGVLRTPSQRTPQASACAPQAGPVIIALDALLALAAWCDQRRGQGDDPCLSTNPSSRPPALSPAHPDSPRSDLDPTPAPATAAPPASARRTDDPLGHD